MRALVGFLVAVSVPARAWAGGFEFTAPPGWTDLSPGAPVEVRAKAPPELVERLETSNSVFVAVDLEHGDNMQATLGPGSIAVDAGVLEELAANFRAQFDAKGTPSRIAESSIVKVGGVPAARLVIAVRDQGKPSKVLHYLLPGDGQFAALAFSATSDRFDQLVPIFDRAALATRGTKQGHPLLDRIVQIAKALGWVAVAALGLVGWLLLPWRFRRRHAG